MKPIACLNDNKEYICLVLNPHDGKDISKENINKLVPIMEKYLSKESSILKDVVIEDGFLKLSSVSEEEIYKTVDLFRKKISERIIVPQVMGTGPTIRHRPLYFGISKDKKNIELKFTELGDFNSFDTALSELNCSCC